MIVHLLMANESCEVSRNSSAEPEHDILHVLGSTSDSCARRRSRVPQRIPFLAKIYFTKMAFLVAANGEPMLSDS